MVVRVVIICIVCFIAASLYWANGRTVFNDQTAPTEAEMETIQSIIDFEEQKLFECQELIKRHSERAKELGVEIIPVLDRCRAVNHDGLVEVHNWDQDMWLPHYYNSRITCYIYKDGEMLEERTSPTSVSHFVNIYWLVYAGKKDTLRFNEKPFEQFDGQFDRLLDSVFVYLQQ